MKTRYSLLLISALVTFTSLFSNSTLAYSMDCDHEIYCKYEGMFRSIDNSEEEFAMIMEPDRHANFQDMFSVLLYIVGCAEESQKCAQALKDNSCTISIYIKKMLAFYKINAANISDEIVTNLFERCIAILNEDTWLDKKNQPSMFSVFNYMVECMQKNQYCRKTMRSKYNNMPEYIEKMLEFYRNIGEDITVEEAILLYKKTQTSEEELEL